MLFRSVEFSELDYKKNTQKTIIKDKNSTPEQVDNAQKELIKLQERQVELIQERSILEDNVYKKNVERLLAESGALKGLTNDEKERAISLAMTTDYLKEQQKEAKRLNEIIENGSRKEMITQQGFGGTVSTVETIVYTADAKDALKALKTVNAYLEISDEKAKEAAESGAMYYRTLSQLEQMKQLDNRLLGKDKDKDIDKKTSISQSVYLEWPDTTDIDEIGRAHV